MSEQEIVLLIAQAKVAALTTYLLQWVKNSKQFPWINQHTWWINRSVSVLIAIGVSLGITYEFHADTGELIIHGLTAASVSRSAWAAVTQWLLQQGWYKTVLSPERPTPVLVPVAVDERTVAHTVQER